MGVIIAGVVVAAVMWLLSRSGKGSGNAESVGGSALTCPSPAINRSRLTDGRPQTVV